MIKYTLIDNFSQIRGLLKLLYTIFRSAFSEVNPLVLTFFASSACIHVCVLSLLFSCHLSVSRHVIIILARLLFAALTHHSRKWQELAI